ncbi:MAG: flagellar hook-length control protein FliK [Desulfobacterales bacterium]
MQNALHASLKKSYHINHDPKKTDATSNEKGYKYYLETFKKALLAQGRPLNEIFLREGDLPMVKKFLLQCGFSLEKVEGFLKDLKADSPDGQINLSYFFQKASELNSPKEQVDQDRIIASSATPYIESILRDFQFTPKDLDSVFTAARVEGGGVDLKKLLAKLKEISTQKPLVDKGIDDQNICQKIIAKMEMIGIHMQNKEKIEQISLKDFLASLEQTAYGENKNDQLSAEIKSTLDGILKRVALSEQNVSSTSSVKISSNYNFTNSLIKERTDKNGNHLFGEKMTSSSEKNKMSGNEAISSFLKQKDDKIVNHGPFNTSTSNHKQKTDIFSGLNKKMGSMNLLERESYRVQTETGQMDGPKNTSSINFADTAKTVERGGNGSRSSLQASLIDQVGKQISRSILRGDRIVRLQLKPPELGTVKLKIDMRDDTLKLGMITEHHSVKELLLNNIHELKQALLHQGVKLEKFDVQINYNFGQTLNGSKEGTNNGHGTGKDLNEKQLNLDTLSEETSVVPVNIISKNSLLDLVA